MIDAQTQASGVILSILMLITKMRQDYVWGSPVSMDYMYFTKHWLKFGFTNQKSLKINDQLQNIHSKQTNKMCDQLKTSVSNKFLELKRTVSMNYIIIVLYICLGRGGPSLTTQGV